MNWSARCKLFRRGPLNAMATLFGSKRSNGTARDASHFDTVQFRHSAISTQKRHFDTDTLQKVSHFDTALDVSTHFLTNALCVFIYGVSLHRLCLS